MHLHFALGKSLKWMKKLGYDDFFLYRIGDIAELSFDAGTCNSSLRKTFRIICKLTQFRRQ